MDGNSDKTRKTKKKVSKNIELNTEEFKVSVSFPIVGMGGSAGAFDAFKKFFLHMPPDPGIAFVIVMHLDPDQTGYMVETFQNFTSLKVIEAEDEMIIESDNIYVIPPNKDLGLHIGKLLLFPPSKSRGNRMPIDYFFQSLAEDQGRKAVGIIFSGMGADGELGLRLIKEKLGMVMVQNPDTAEYNSMPQNAIATNQVDYILPPNEMPLKLVQYLSHPTIEENSQPEKNDFTIIQKILMLLRSHIGHDFSLYKNNSITRRIDRRLALHQFPDYNHYVNYLRGNPNELNILFNELLIGVTRFFRDQAAFEALQESLIRLMKTKIPGENIRVWVSACSTGEEAYSVAMLLLEYLDRYKSEKKFKVQIFATDLDPHAIEFARQGIYKSNIMTDVSPERLERFFIKKDDSFVVKKELRELIVFAQHNVIKDAPFTKLDLLCCRNLLIYLTPELQKKLIPLFHYSLNYKGILLLGPSETIGVLTDLFAIINSKWKLFERKEGHSVGKSLDFPFNISKQKNDISISVPKNQKEDWIAETFNKILLENFTPPSIIINEKGDILYINGKMGNYLEITSGEAVMNVFKLAREELKYAISNAIHLAIHQKENISITDVHINDKEEVRMIDIKARFIDHLPANGLVILIFEDKGILKKLEKKPGKKKNYTASGVEELEKELLYTKQQLHSTIEQMETSLEVLKATNEELQSTNEELQSTNEESLNNKEEMQSLNEELITINYQYQSKAEELSLVNNDIKNMLDSTNIATLFVDHDLKVLRFTPQLHKNFRILKSDIGRSIIDIVPNFNFLGIEKLIREVIDNLSTKEIEKELFDNTWYSVRIMPYRTLDNFISGAVLTFTNITHLKNLQKEAQIAYGALQKLIFEEKDFLVALDQEFKVKSASKSFLQFFQFNEQDILQNSFFEIEGGKWNFKNLQKLLVELSSNHPIDEPIQMEEAFPGAVNKRIKFKIRSLVNDEKNSVQLILLNIYIS